MKKSTNISFPWRRRFSLQDYCLNPSLKIFFFFFICVLSSGKVGGYQDPGNKNGNNLSTNVLSTTYLDIKKKLDHSLLNNNLKAAALHYQQIAELLFTEGAHVQALDYYLKAKHLYSNEYDNISVALVQNRIGHIYFRNKRYPFALKNFQQALNTFIKNKNSSGATESYSSIGHVYEKMGKADSASYFFNLALGSWKTEIQKSQSPGTYEEMGSIYEDLGDFKNALKCFVSAKNLYYKFKRDLDPGLINNIGDSYRKLHQYPEALFYSRNAENLALMKEDNREISSAQRDLAKTYEMLGKYDSAFFYSEKARVSFASISNKDNNEQLNLLQTLYGVQQKDSAIKSLESERYIDRILISSIVIIGILLGLIGFTLISRQRLKMVNERMLHQTQSKTMELSLNNQRLLQENLKAELEVKSKELTSHSLHIIQKNQFLDKLKEKIGHLIKDDKRDQKRELKQIISLINSNSNQDKNWEDFRIIFENVHDSFFEKLKLRSASLTATDLRFLALLKMNLSSSDIATMLGITQDSLRTTRYRVRKKLQLPEDDNLLSFIQGF
jgi:tetratricopeptide (TPR) repeat protein